MGNLNNPVVLQTILILLIVLFVMAAVFDISDRSRVIGELKRIVSKLKFR